MYQAYQDLPVDNNQRNNGSKRIDSHHRNGRDHLTKASVHKHIADHRSAQGTGRKNNPPEQRGPSLLCLRRALIYDKCAWAPTCSPTFTIRTSDWLVTQLRTFGSRIKPASQSGYTATASVLDLDNSATSAQMQDRKPCRPAIRKPTYLFYTHARPSKWTWILLTSKSPSCCADIGRASVAGLI
ncbi:hypothetical protein T265_06611 [Opisthorchis viverrini]|uniref:Uncharacterized protein n=1 Tax=Opisthorchis viverrini TaxID=6198 RepID=A0A074ZJS3_OPIVI|nr:hypothetical protein T265_06611 [Opisthorchis viverrini]KER26032.1 hypothetical protein T265_06611 [Opisthorchis viverrini]